MCLVIKNSRWDGDNHTPLIAKRNIICYKRLRKVDKELYTPYRQRIVKLGDVMIAAYFTFDGNEVNRGIHAYTNKRYAYSRTWSDEILVKCIIPKGTEYFPGTNSTIVALKMKLTKIILKNAKILQN